MGRKPFRTPDEKLAVVLSVLKGESTQVEVARRLEMSQTTIAKWQKQFLEGGREILARATTRSAWRRDWSRSADDKTHGSPLRRCRRTAGPRERHRHRWR